MPALFEDHQVLLFTVGLQEPLSLDVQMQNPTMLEIVTSLVHLYERRNSSPPRRAQRHGLLPLPLKTSTQALELAPRKAPVAPLRFCAGAPLLARRI